MRWTPTRYPSARQVALAVALLASSLPATLAAEETTEPLGPYDGLEYRLIGPAAGGRVSRVAGVPGDPRTYWAATSAGGAWKSVNGGTEWRSMTDDLPVSSMGSIAVSPADPNLVWLGSGEANIRGNVAEGGGIFRSTDAGESWAHVWEAEGQIGTLIAHPTDSDVAFAAVLGSPFGPGSERGIYRTRDGGESWERVLFVDDETGASDVAFRPDNPRILLAGTWQTRRSPWGLTSGGAGSGLWSSRDGGDSWKRLEGAGLPEGIWGRVGVQFAPSEPSRVYALIEAEEGGLFRSEDGGESWSRVSTSRGIRQRAWYYTTLTVDPKRPDVVWFPQVAMLKSLDGGKSLFPVEAGGWDYHDLWIDPVDPQRMVVGSDAGVSLSRDGGETWTRPPLPISQFYHLSVDSRTPYRVLGSLQDWGTVSGPSRTLHGGDILLSDWHSVGGGEAGHVVADPSDPGIVWAGEYLGIITRWDERSRRAPHVGIGLESGSGRGAGELRHRFQWTAPIVISPHDPQTVYHAANVLFRTRDGGQSWEAISPDLTRDDAEKQKWAGGPITGDNTGVEYYDTIFAVAESPLEAGTIWAGSDDGLVHLTRDAGENWTDVTPPDMPEWATVSTIEASRFDAGTAYVVADLHRLDDESPFLWKTADYGASWSRLDAGLDAETYLHVVREDSVQRDLLYLGSERGVLVSRDGGRRWTSLRLNLPTVSVVDLAVTPNALVVGTLGRSAWVLDDLTPLRVGPVETPIHLYEPPPAVAWALPGSWSGPLGSDDGAGENPPAGALITYRLAEALEAPLVMELLDDEGTVVRSLSSEIEPPFTPPGHPDAEPGAETEAELPKSAGIHRVAWDLEYEPARWVANVPTDAWGPVLGPPALPGDYVVRLRSGETSIERPLRLLADPRTPYAPAAARQQFEMMLSLRDSANRIVDLVEAIRSVREQIESRNARLAGEGDHSGVVEAGESIVRKLWKIERALHNPDAEVTYDILAGRNGGAKLYSQYAWLSDSAVSHTGPPTQGYRERRAQLDAALDAQVAAYEKLVAEDVAELNRAAATAGLGHVLVP